MGYDNRVYLVPWGMGASLHFSLEEAHQFVVVKVMVPSPHDTHPTILYQEGNDFQHGPLCHKNIHTFHRWMVNFVHICYYNAALHELNAYRFAPFYFTSSNMLFYGFYRLQEGNNVISFILVAHLEDIPHMHLLIYPSY